MFSKQSLTHLFSGVCTSCSRVLWMIKCLIDIFLNGNIILVLLKIKIHFSIFFLVFTLDWKMSQRKISAHTKKNSCQHVPRPKVNNQLRVKYSMTYCYYRMRCWLERNRHQNSIFKIFHFVKIAGNFFFFVYVEY